MYLFNSNFNIIDGKNSRTEYGAKLLYIDNETKVFEDVSNDINHIKLAIKEGIENINIKTNSALIDFINNVRFSGNFKTNEVNEMLDVVYTEISIKEKVNKLIAISLMSEIAYSSHVTSYAEELILKLVSQKYNFSKYELAIAMFFLQRHYFVFGPGIKEAENTKKIKEVFKDYLPKELMELQSFEKIIRRGGRGNFPKKNTSLKHYLLELVIECESSLYSANVKDKNLMFKYLIDIDKKPIQSKIFKDLVCSMVRITSTEEEKKTAKYVIYKDIERSNIRSAESKVEFIEAKATIGWWGKSEFKEILNYLKTNEKYKMVKANKILD